MPDLTNTDIQSIINILQSGGNLPPEYKPLLFPETTNRSLISTIRKAAVDDQESEPEEPLILVVDDNENNRLLLTDQLEWHNFTVITAEDGRIGIEIVRENPVDVILLDIMMPEMNGFETLEYLKQDEELRHIPVIMISALNDMKSIVRCIEMGAEDYLPKPFNPTLLKARIGASLEKKRLRDQEQAYLSQLEIEKAKSEKLLLNILPLPVANQLLQGQGTIAEAFPEATVLFADIVGFSSLASHVSATDLVDLLNRIFSIFDDLVEIYHLEKIKTIGDSYMVVGGLPTPRQDHVESIADMALHMREEIADFKGIDDEPFNMRIGIHTGPVVAGVIGRKKFIYDLWGDTVNVASRMEAYGISGSIQVTEAVYSRLQESYDFNERGILDIKGKGEMMTYLLIGKQT